MHYWARILALKFWWPHLASTLPSTPRVPTPVVDVVEEGAAGATDVAAVVGVAATAAATRWTPTRRSTLTHSIRLSPSPTCSYFVVHWYACLAEIAVNWL